MRAAFQLLKPPLHGAAHHKRLPEFRDKETVAPRSAECSPRVRRGRHVEKRIGNMPCTFRAVQRPLDLSGTTNKRAEAQLCFLALAPPKIWGGWTPRDMSKFNRDNPRLSQ